MEGVEENAWASNSWEPILNDICLCILGKGLMSLSKSWWRPTNVLLVQMSLVTNSLCSSTILFWMILIILDLLPPGVTSQSLICSSSEHLLFNHLVGFREHQLYIWNGSLEAIIFVRYLGIWGWVSIYGCINQSILIIY